MNVSDIGLIGLAVMGENLALNMERNGFSVSLYNREHGEEHNVVDRFLAGRGAGKRFRGTHTIGELAGSVSRPRKIMMMVKAGTAVDELIEQLLPFLSQGDILIDGGNSDFHDTERRMLELERQGILFVGTGISGGEEGALNGPSVMPGGSLAAWPQVKDVLQSIAAKLDDGTPCCEWIGSGGAGHFVKMVHNGIEYGDMQLIAEAYSLLKHSGIRDNDEIASVFREWNEGELKSFLIEITANILAFRDDKGAFLLDLILDVAGQKGTGKWSAGAALDGGVPFSTVTEAVYARFLSALLDDREKASHIYRSGENFPVLSIEGGRETVGKALYASKLISYAQGFSLMRQASEYYGWDLDCGSIARIWRKGCIIRSAFLTQITGAYTKDPALRNLLFDSFFSEKIRSVLPSWRSVVAAGALGGVALPCISSALAYFDGLSTLYSPANLIQAQRDYFGAHTYERRDAARGLFFHTDWTGLGGSTVSGSYNV